MDLDDAVSNDSANGTREGQLRILFVPWDRFPPFRPAAKAIFLHELPKRGHRIDWLIQADESSPDAETRKIPGGFAFIGRTDAGHGLSNRLRKHVLNFLNACRMVPLMRKYRYDIIQAKDNFSAAIVGIFVARAYGIPFFYWVAYPRAESSIYEGRARMARYPLLYRIRGHVMKFVLYRIILPAADHVFVQSERMKDDIATKGIAREKMTPVPSAVDLDRVPYETEAVSDKLIEKQSNKWIVYLGTLKRVRRLDFVIRSFSLVTAAEPDAVLFVIGKGDRDSDLTELEHEAKRLGVGQRVVFTGFLDMADAWEFIRHADVCISPIFPTPILDLGSPTKLVEYMAMGRPVVANDHPEQSLVISESRGGLCTPWEERAFADAIIRVLANPREAAEMGKHGREYVERHRTNQAMGDVVEDAFTRFSTRAAPSGVTEDQSRG